MPPQRATAQTRRENRVEQVWSFICVNDGCLSPVLERNLAEERATTCRRAKGSIQVERACDGLKRVEYGRTIGAMARVRFVLPLLQTAAPIWNEEVAAREQLR